MLSLYGILKEITARIGPRTGAFEIDKSVVLVAAREIQRELDFRSSMGIANNVGFYIDIKNPITGKQEQTKVLILSPPGPGGAEANWNITKNSIQLFIDFEDLAFKNLDPQTKQKSQTNKIYSVLMHELAHKFDPTLQRALDLSVINTNLPAGNSPTYVTNPYTGEQISKRVVKKKRYITHTEDQTGYFNQPYEVTTHLQQVVEEIENNIPNIRYVLKKNLGHRFTWEEIVEILKRRPEIILNNSKTWMNIKSFLTPKNEKRFLKAAARLAMLL